MIGGLTTEGQWDVFKHVRRQTTTCSSRIFIARGQTKANLTFLAVSEHMHPAVSFDTYCLGKVGKWSTKVYGKDEGNICV